MEYYVFKLNLEPYTLRKNNYFSDRKYVIETLIPEELKKFFPDYEEIDYDKVKFYDVVDFTNIKSSSTYNNLLRRNEKMIEMYKSVVEDYESGKGIVYDPIYLEQRNKLSKTIESIIFEFPALKNAYEISDNIFRVEAYSNVKMALTYIRKAKKIEEYVNGLDDRNTIISSEFVYDSSNEHIYISTDKTPEEAREYIEILQDKINKYCFNSKIGRVTINPVYEDFILEGSYTEITFEIVYPNGNRARERSKAIEYAEAAREKRTFEASKGKSLDVENLAESFKEDAKKGYIKSVKSKGKSIIKSAISKVSLL